MMMKSIKNIALLPLLAFMALTSCTDDELTADDNDVPQEIKDGYSLTFTVTLDKMGGINTRATSLTEENQELEEMENYVDLQKFRVLFFASDDIKSLESPDGTTSEDDKDVFLFESTSRWVKKQGTSDYSRWFVSVPLFGYGNDNKYNWNWGEIRDYLTTHNFKIAILANRPDLEWNMGITGSKSQYLVQKKWFDNTGPHWTQDHTKWGTHKKKIFDLHHCQYDPIYDGKNYDNKTDVNYDVYDFIAGTIGEGDKDVDEEGKSIKGKPTMGATSTWVNWDHEDDGEPKSETFSDLRHWLHPDTDHPIPMYGIQEFKPIPKNVWKKGTSFSLNPDNKDREDKAISLLRSVVKLELLIPETIKTNYVVIFYPNLYARCEPMDIWTPTDQIWNEDLTHEITQGLNRCEWFDIIDYGVVTRGAPAGEPTATSGNNGYNPTLSKAMYQQRMSWFYGYWKKRTDWPFGSLGRNGVVNENIKYPRIFNTCIQRNTAVSCDDNVKDQVTIEGVTYNRWVVYCGERNINDPSNLLAMGASGSGNATIIYWMIGTKNPSTSYCFPIIDYAKVQNDKLKDLMQPNGLASSYADNIPRKNGATGDANGIINKYERQVQMGLLKPGDPGYKGPDDDYDYPYPKPWPLLRNHVYRIIVGEASNTRAGESELNVIKSEINYSESIRFE